MRMRYESQVSNREDKGRGLFLPEATRSDRRGGLRRAPLNGHSRVVYCLELGIGLIPWGCPGSTIWLVARRTKEVEERFPQGVVEESVQHLREGIYKLGMTSAWNVTQNRGT